jgi:hypothetical protein
LDKSKVGPSDDPKNSKFDRHIDDSDEEDDKEDSKGSHDSEFSRLTREQKEEKARKAKLEKAGGSSWVDKMEVDDEEFDLSQSNQGNSRDSADKELWNDMDVSMGASGETMEKEKRGSEGAEFCI